MGIVAVCVIVSVAMFSGCVEEETATPGVSATPIPTAPLKTDPDNATIDKTPWMKIIFHDPLFSFQLQRTLGYTYYGGADVEKCLSTACRIGDGDFESWYEEWTLTADRVCGIADTCLADGNNVSAREAYLRASDYYHTTEFFHHHDPVDPRILEIRGKSRAASCSFIQSKRHRVRPGKRTAAAVC